MNQGNYKIAVSLAGTEEAWIDFLRSKKTSEQVIYLLNNGEKVGWMSRYKYTLPPEVEEKWLFAKRDGINGKDIDKGFDAFVEAFASSLGNKYSTEK